ncbi:MAG: PD40 domain-containing protein [Alphaproteobacteria bacterium]|nr:PD40 domain-containing protein [Alphaproteobacteria bacterium]MBL6937455.1 PD40 domain-containing protein [Alphaproteobacteria bacterium]MBL7098793.1 PD40 domain-containing protein [Alphaproteobacteria bacterium]
MASKAISQSLQMVDPQIGGELNRELTFSHPSHLRMLGVALAAAVLAGAPAQAAIATADHGNIVVNGKAITHSGNDSDPLLTPDGKRVVFQRDSGNTTADWDCSGSGIGADRKVVSLWVANVDGSGAHKLLDVKPDMDMKKTICAFRNAQFSSDGRLLYFETPAWATSGALHVYDFRTGREHFVIDSNGTQVLAKCAEPDYRDKLIVTQHKYFVFGGSYDWPWLISPDGKNLGLIGGDNADLNAIVKGACS